jgi:predicted adenylyl cyclase CyaB
LSHILLRVYCRQARNWLAFLMARNIEIKAHVSDLAALTERVAEVATTGPFEIHQDDTFFRCASGRLKLRAFSDTDGELIFYRRTDQHGPKESFYIRTPTQSPDLLRQSLTLAYGHAGRVVKHRTLYTVGRTRVHLDRVDGLGDFMELEVVLQGDEPSEAGVAEAHTLMAQLGIKASSLMDAAYVDLLAQRTAVVQ